MATQGWLIRASVGDKDTFPLAQEPHETGADDPFLLTFGGHWMLTSSDSGGCPGVSTGVEGPAVASNLPLLSSIRSDVHPWDLDQTLRRRDTRGRSPRQRRE